MICVIATVNLKEGTRSAYLNELRKIIADVHKEQGNIEYAANVDAASGLPFQMPARPDTVVIIEKWESLDDLKKHMTAPHMISYTQATKGMIQSVQIQILDPA